MIRDKKSSPCSFGERESNPIAKYFFSSFPRRNFSSSALWVSRVSISQKWLVWSGCFFPGNIFLCIFQAAPPSQPASSSCSCAPLSLKGLLFVLQLKEAERDSENVQTLISLCQIMHKIFSEETSTVCRNFGCSQVFLEFVWVSLAPVLYTYCIHQEITAHHGPKECKNMRVKNLMDFSCCNFCHEIEIISKQLSSKEPGFVLHSGFLPRQNSREKSTVYSGVSLIRVFSLNNKIFLRISWCISFFLLSRSWLVNLQRKWTTWWLTSLD